MKTDFENKLFVLGISYQCNTDGLYVLYKNNVTNSILNAQLICSEPVDESKLGSLNGNVIQSIGHFKLKLPTEVQEQDFIILAFPNTNSHCVEFIIIPVIELIKSLNRENRISSDNLEIEMVFWLMPDNHVYETTDIGVEGEWYYLSKGLNGRMADGSSRDYSKFLNDWVGLNIT
jgi:hypothetical protein